MKKVFSVFLILLAFSGNPAARAQSVTFYLCNDCTYQSATDGETITFRTNGRVKINGKAAPAFRCRNNDGVVELFYKGKLINNLSWYEGQKKGCELLDDRGIGYQLLGCTGDMPPVSELMNGTRSKSR